MKKYWKLIILTILALVPGYLIRYGESVYMWFYTRFSTYPGDLWNFFANYLAKGLHYPPEYPAGLRWFYEVMGFYKYHDYTQFFSVNAIILTLFACGITYLIYRISQIRRSHPEHSEGSDLDEILHSVQNDNKKNIRVSNILIFWILAPSFIFYSFLNYDLPVVFMIVLAVYLYYKKMPYWSIVALAVGTVLKVFPVFLLPIFVLKSPKKDWIKMVVLFGVVVLALNATYMIRDFSSWIFPYTWQIGENVSKDPTAGTYWWIFYPYLKSHLGWVSLGLFAGLYAFTYLKLRKTSLINLSIAVILIFLATDRIYSPQYNLYLLPFLAMADYKVNKGAFYLLEIPNVIHVFAIFWLREHLYLFQSLIALKYIGIVWLYCSNYTNSLKISNYPASPAGGQFSIYNKISKSKK